MNHLLKSCAVSAAALAVAMLTGCTSPKGEPQTFEIGNKEFLLNGKPFLIKAAEIHYTRIPAEYWEHRIEMCKALGMNTICIYAFWNIHEQRPGEFDFEGQNDVALFCRPRNTACISCCAPVRMSARNGKWADCPGGCSRRKILPCVPATRISWNVPRSS